MSSVRVSVAEPYHRFVFDESGLVGEFEAMSVVTLIDGAIGMRPVWILAQER